MQNSSPLVSIICTTFNHEDYIKQCLDGLLMQKTTFAFEIIVHDDASTDNTVSILKDYERKHPQIFHNIYRHNNWYSNGKNIWQFLFLNEVRGKYIALCEGDDYWIDPLKLQKQVDLLEEKETISLVHSDVNIYYHSSMRIEYFANRLYSLNESIKSNLQENILSGNYIIRTATVVLRASSVKLIYSDPIFRRNFTMSDIQTWISILDYGDITYLPIVTAVYRYSNTSVTKHPDYRKYLLYSLDCLELRLFYIQNRNYFKYQTESFKYGQYNKTLLLCKLFDRGITKEFYMPEKNRCLSMSIYLSKIRIARYCLQIILEFLYFCRVKSRDCKLWQQMLYIRRRFLAYKKIHNEIK